jgi:hypothetical protein
MKIKMLKTLNDTLQEGRVIGTIAKDVCCLLIRQGDAEEYIEVPPLIPIVTEPDPEAKPKK